MEGRGMGGIDSVGTERFIDVVVFVISLPLHLRRSMRFCFRAKLFWNEKSDLNEKSLRFLDDRGRDV